MARHSRHNRRQKRSIWKQRGMILRVLGYLRPFKKLVMGALAISFFSGFLAGATLLPLIPAIKAVLDFGQVQVDEERMEQKRKEREEERDRISEYQEIGSDALDSFEGRFAWVEKTRLWLSEKKYKAREEMEEFLLDHRRSAIWWIAAFLLAATTMRVFVTYQAEYMLTKAVYRATQHLKVDLYTSCLALDLGSLQERTSGNIISRLNNDLKQVQMIMQTVTTELVLVPFQIFFFLLVLLIIDVKVTLITIIFLPLVIVPISLIGSLLRQMSKRDMEEDAYLVDVMQETLQGMQIIKAFNAETLEQRRFRRVSRDQVRRQIRRMKLRLGAPAIVDVLTMAAMAAVLVAGAHLVMNPSPGSEPRMDTASFIVYLVALTRFYRPLKNLSKMFVKVQKGLAGADRVFEVIDTQPTLTEKPDARELPAFTQEIAFDHVDFRYRSDSDPVLSDFSLTIPYGKRYALVGATGAGKTSVVRLLPRFWDPEKGTVRIDGLDLRDVTFKSLRTQISIVTQETVLFDDTIYYNIAYGRRNAKPEEVEAAARAANIHEFILELPEGYNTRIGERGSKLSGGQRQRLAIARAILRNSPILILDEATSALDNKTEALIQEALERLMENRTVLVIAHRLSTVRNCDQIVLMDRGRIVEQGTHEELYEKGGRYWQLCVKEFAPEENKAQERDVQVSKASA